MFFLLFQHAQSTQQRQAGINQRRQLTRKGRQYFGLHPAAEAGDFDLEIESPAFFCAFSARRRAPCLLALGFFLYLLDLDDLGREQAHFLDPADGFVLGGDLECALALLAVRVHCHVIVFWHNQVTCT